ncbi:MAG: DnaJ domain-containing protein [Chitinophagales bacterium]|jgi:molecular chaperone DnaJ|nr:DnaJ domain-containing protein [Chitinophagales bacterium]
MNLTQAYKILESNESMDIAEIRRKYRILVLRYHPDRNSAPNAHEKFVALKDAFQFVEKFHIKKQYTHSDFEHKTTQNKAYKEKMKQRMQTQNKESVFEGFTWKHILILGLIFRILLRLIIKR